MEVTFTRGRAMNSKQLLILLILYLAIATLGEGLCWVAEYGFNFWEVLK